MILNVPKGQIVLETNVPAILSAEITRPANTTSYSAGDAIGAAAASVKEKNTITLAGVFGTAIISVGGVSKVATFHTDLSTTAADFVTANSAAYLAAGIVLTSSTDTLIFEANVAGIPMGAPTIEYTTSTLAGTVAHVVANQTAVKKKDTITIAGTSGYLGILFNGVVYETYFDTDLTTTAAKFVTDYAADFLAAGVVLTSSVADLIFEAQTAGVDFASPAVVVDAETLTASVTEVVARVAAVAQEITLTLTGTTGVAHITYGNFLGDAVFDTDLVTTAEDFVTDFEDELLGYGVVLTAGVLDTLIFTSATPGVPIEVPVITNISGTLDGAAAETVANVVAEEQMVVISFTGNVGAVTVDIPAIFTGDVICKDGEVELVLAQYLIDNYDYVLGYGVLMEQEGRNLVLHAINGTDMGTVTATDLVYITGTLVHTTANRASQKQHEVITFTGVGQASIGAAGGLTKTVNANTYTIQQALKNFLVANYALYDAQGITILDNGNELWLTAKVAGTGFTAPTVTTLNNLSGTNVVTTANVTLAPLTFSDAVQSQGGGVVMDAKLETDATQFGTKTVRVWLFKEVPSSVVGDNVAYVSLYADADVRLPYFDMTFTTLLSGSDTVIAKAQPTIEYVTDDKIYAIIQTLDDVATPKSAGKFRLDLSVVKL